MGIVTTSDRLDRERVLGLASVLEVSMKQHPPRYEQAVNTATMIRNIVKGGAPLTSAEKVQVVKCLAMAKAKVNADKTEESLKVYKKLNAISDELLRLL